MEDAIFAGAGKKKIDELHSVWNKIVAEKYPERDDFVVEDNLFDSTENSILHKKAINNINALMVGPWMNFAIFMFKLEEYLQFCMAVEFFIVGEHMYFLFLLWLVPKKNC